MKITITIPQSVAILAGSNQHGQVDVDVDPATLTQAQRIEWANGGDWLTATAVPVDVGALLDARAAARAAKAAEVAAECERLMSSPDIRAKILRQIARGRACDLPSGSSAWIAEHKAEYAADIESAKAAIKAEAEAEAEQARQVKIAADERRAAAAVEKAAGLERLREWAAGPHASERLHLMLSTDTGDWESVAHDEFVAAVAPGGYSANLYRAGRDAPRNKPTEEELKALVAARGLCGSVLSDPQLVWTRVDEENDEFGEVTVERDAYAALHLTVTCPDGEKFMIARKF